MVADEVGRSGIPRECLNDQLRQPIGRRMPGHGEPKQLAMPVTDDYECKQAFECHRVDYAQIDCCDRIGMVAQKRSPGLRRRPAMADHIFGDRRLGDLEPKLLAIHHGCGAHPRAGSPCSCVE